MELLQQQFATAAATAAEVDSLRGEAESRREELNALRESSAIALQGKETELAAAKENCAILKEEILSLQVVIEGLKASAAARAASVAMAAGAGSTHSLERLPSDFGVGALPSPAQTVHDDDNDSIASASLAELAKREKELAIANRHMSELRQEVGELERDVELRGVQEKVLKEAVRELTREIERIKLSNKSMDMEYFKNVMLKLFETGEEESLLPVVSTMLQFSPEELTRCRKGLEERTAHRAALAAARGEAAQVTSYLSNWLGFGGAVPEGEDEEGNERRRGGAN